MTRLDTVQSEEEEEEMSTVHTYSVTVEGVEDPGYIAAQDANRDACVVQRQPATASLL